MIRTGTINDTLEPKLELKGGVSATSLVPMSLLLDTGYNGCVALGPGSAVAFGVLPLFTGSIDTVQGTTPAGFFDFWLQIQDEDPTQVRGITIKSDFDLLGMGFLIDATISMTVQQDGTFTVEFPDESFE